MMKNTKKKLKPKHFRYLSKDYVKEPLRYIQYFYTDYELEAWQEKVYLFMTSGSAPDRPPLLDPFHIHQHLINHIDIAYIIYHRGTDGATASRFLDYFFEIKCRKRWLEMVDELLKNETDENYGHDEDNYNRCVILSLELLYYLSYFFHLLFIQKPEDFEIPTYILPYHSLSDAEQKQTSSLKHISSTQDTIHETPIPFYHKERVTLPEWLAPQPFSTDAVQDFFQISALSEWKNELWNWFQAVITEDLFWSADQKNLSGATLLYNYSCFYSLLEMYRSQLNHKLTITSTDKQNHGRSIFKEHNDFTIRHHGEKIVFRYILQEDVNDPLCIILGLINQYSKVEWDEIVYDWLSYGLSSSTNKDSHYSDQTTRVYQTLVKIVELSYILAYKDEIEFTPCQTDIAK